MKKSIIRNPDRLKGKTKKEILFFLGDNYHSEYDGSIWVYVIKKKWYNRKERAIIIDFGSDEIAAHVKKITTCF